MKTMQNMKKQLVNPIVSLKFVLSVVIAFCSVSALFGYTVRIWDGNGYSDASGLWSVAANWSDDDVPDDNSEYAVLPNVLSGCRTVTADGDYFINQLSMNQERSSSTNKLVLGGVLNLFGTSPLNLVSPANNLSSLQIDFNGNTLVTSNRNYAIELDGTVVMGAGSKADFVLDNNQAGLDIVNKGNLIQDSSTIFYRWAVPSANNVSAQSQFTRSYDNTGNWVLTNGAAFLLSGITTSPGGFGLLRTCKNSGNLEVVDCSTNMFFLLTNDGTVTLGDNSLLGYGNSTLYNAQGGEFYVTGINAMLGLSSSMSPGSGTSILDNDGEIRIGKEEQPASLTIRNVSLTMFSNRVDGVVSMAPGSSLNLQYVGHEGAVSWYNFGAVTQDNATVVFDWAGTRNGTSAHRDFYNAGIWSLNNESGFIHISTTGRPTGWALKNCINSGELSVLSGSRLTFKNLNNSGDLYIGDNVLLSMANDLGTDKTFFCNTGTTYVTGTNNLLGYIIPSNRVHSIFVTNGTFSTTGSTIRIGDGETPASIDLLGAKLVELVNNAGNTIIVSRAASLGLICNTIGNYENGGIRLINDGTIIHSGELWLRSNWYPNYYYISNFGEYRVKGDTTTDVLMGYLPGMGSGQAGRAMVIHNEPPGVISGCGRLVFTNLTGNAGRETLTVNSSSTIAPGDEIGELELVNTAVTLNNGTLAIRVVDGETYSKLKLSGTGAALNLTGENDTIDVAPAAGTKWDGAARIRIFEGAPVSGEFDNLLWKGEPAEGAFKIIYGTNNIDLMVYGTRPSVVIIK